MPGLHEKQQKVLDFLLDRPDGATLEEVATQLGITKTAAKEHILKLDAYGLLQYRDTKGSVGRPRRRYLLSPEGHEFFPRQYSWLSNSLLELLAVELGPEEVMRLMKKLAHRVTAPLAEKFAGAKSTADLLGRITEKMNELGYRASLKQSDLRKGAVIEATNCVYHSVAKEHPALCKFDIQLIENATGGMQVKLEKCITRGDSVCRFCIRKN